MTSIRSFIKKLLHQEDDITIVSGLPRSGTSMMMSALQAGGVPLLIDGQREADPNNPKGYYEYELVKKLPNGQTRWVLSAQGKAVKVISALLSYLPEDFHFRVIFMERNIEEILASQRHMLEREGIIEEKPLSDEALREDYQKHLEEIREWLDSQDWIEALYISYNQVLRHPMESFREVDRFLAPKLDIKAMAQVVDPTLYREQELAGN